MFLTHPIWGLSLESSLFFCYPRYPLCCGLHPLTSFLLEDVLVYLKSVKPYFANDDDFNWNYGLACAAAGDYKEGKEGLFGAISWRFKFGQ